MPRSDQPSRDVACDLIADVLRGGQSVTIRAHGTSMLPAIWPGDRLTVRPVRATLPAVGEIALTLWEGGLRAHRVIACSDHDVMTQGDALEVGDPAIERAAILGTVAYRNGEPLENRANLLRGAFGGLVTSCRPLRFIVLKLIALRRRFEQDRGWEPRIA
jgi:hypothetical protein